MLHTMKLWTVIFAIALMVSTPTLAKAFDMLDHDLRRLHSSETVNLQTLAAETCFVNFGVTFDMMATIPVRGADAHPLFAELARQSRAPRWNFNKYLVNPDGEVVEVFGAMTGPESAKLKAAIEGLLEGGS